MYLWGIMEEMAVGKYKHITEYNIKDLTHDILNDKLFGFVEVDIEVPDKLYEVKWTLKFLMNLKCRQFLKMLLLMQLTKKSLVTICIIIVNKIIFH